MEYWIWLSKISGIGVRTRRALLEHFHTPQAVYRADIEELLQMKGIGERKAYQIFYDKDLDTAKRILERCERSGIGILPLSHMAYPTFAKSISDMPTHLYYRGILRADSIGTAIVGPRRCSREEKEVAILQARQLVQEGTPVISGMAKGIDSYAHTACLKANGYTVAVLGNGLDLCYPKEHDLLMKRIAERGLLLSEYEPGVFPNRMYFPLRNRIIAAWSKEVRVVGVRRNSGAMITAKYARCYERLVTFPDKNTV